MLSFLDPAPDSSANIVWEHRMATTDHTLFTAPMRQSLNILHLGSSRVQDLAEFIWGQRPEAVTGELMPTHRYTMTFIKQACAAP